LIAWRGRKTLGIIVVLLGQSNRWSRACVALTMRRIRINDDRRDEHEKDGTCGNAAVPGCCGQRIRSDGPQPSLGSSTRDCCGSGHGGGCCRAGRRSSRGSAGAVAGTVGAAGAVAGGVVGRPVGMTATGYNYCPAGHVPYNPPNTPPPNVTGWGYCIPVLAPAAAPGRVVARY
jgi:hypothetical protein